MRVYRFSPVVRGFVCTLLVALYLGSCPTLTLGEDGAPRGWSAASPQTASHVEPFNAQSSVLRMVGGLFLCFGVLGFGLHLYKRHVLPRALSSARRLQMVERLQLSQKSALVLVKLDGKEFLMATGAEASRLVPLQRPGEELFDETLESACNEVGEYNV